MDIKNTFQRREILHVDINNCYASIMQANYPKLRGLPIIVGGDVEARHGIVLAKSYEAKAYGIKTGETVREARDKCPHLISVPPNYKLFLRYSGMLREILSSYTNRIEPFGIDEAWCDVSDSVRIYGSGECIANEIRQRVKDEMGVSVSVGVSFTKTFAKLGSDYKKPDATTVITPDNFRDIVWPLPVNDLLGVGHATKKKLLKYGIYTIGDLANTEIEYLRSWLHKWGVYLHVFANGMDPTPVSESGYESIIKSIGNSRTTHRDLVNEKDVFITFLNLAESVAERLREIRLQGRVIQVGLRDNGLNRIERQLTLDRPTNLASEMTDRAMQLLRQHYKWDKPLRSIGIRAMSLVPEHKCVQMDLFCEQLERDKKLINEQTLDKLRERFGHESIFRGIMLTDHGLGMKHTKADNIIHPVGYYNNG